MEVKVKTYCCQQKYKVFSESKRHEKVLWSPASRPRAPPTLRAERGSSSQATCTWKKKHKSARAICCLQVSAIMILAITTTSAGQIKTTKHQTHLFYVCMMWMGSGHWAPRMIWWSDELHPTHWSGAVAALIQPSIVLNDGSWVTLLAILVTKITSPCHSNPFKDLFL